MSGLPSPLKSPVPIADQDDEPGLASVVWLVTLVPFIVQIIGAPVVVFCQTMSALPSPSKSADPTMCQARPGADNTACDDVVPLLTSMISASPDVGSVVTWPRPPLPVVAGLVSWNAMSEVRSPLK